VNWFTRILQTIRYKTGKPIPKPSPSYLDEETLKKARKIISNVSEQGDKALLEYLAEFHGIREPRINVEEWEIDEAYKKTDPSIIDALESIKSRVEQVSKKLLPGRAEIMVSKGLLVGVKWMPVEKVGIYGPAGNARYPSSVIMAGVPAYVAGSSFISVSTPPIDGRGSVDPGILVASDMIGAEKIYRLGGAYAAAAMALGTESVARVDKIAGPGGKWFTAAKTVVSQYTGIDMLAGPTELVVVADGSVNPGWVALDLAAQAEHSTDTTVYLVSTSEEYMDRVNEALNEIQAIREYPLIERGYGVIVDNLKDAVSVVGEIAPEHLYIAVREPPRDILEWEWNAGLITLGEYSAPALSDYSTGANHILPTGGSARYRGGLTPLDFLRPMYYVYTLEEGFKKACREAVVLSEAEGLFLHSKSIRVRGC
jgi:histidinol dehydrogenase